MRFLVAWRACVGTHHAVCARVTGNAGYNLADKSTNNVQLLQARPASQTKVIQRDGTIMGWECAAIKFTIREVRIDSAAARVGSS